MRDYTQKEYEVQAFCEVAEQQNGNGKESDSEEESGIERGARGGYYLGVSCVHQTCSNGCGPPNKCCVGCR